VLERYDFVPITGLLDLFTTLGVFIQIEGRRVYLPDTCMLTTARKFSRGEIVTIEILRSVAEREGLIAGGNGS
jgi:hypothetical protein